MLKQQITNIILEMIGDDRDLTGKNIVGTSLYNDDIGYNQALSDIRSKASELTDTIVNMIVEKIEEYANSQTDEAVAMGIIGTVSLLKD
jgi:hypothetical protein